MKSKKIIAIVSVVLNLVLYAALMICANNIASRAMYCKPPVFSHIQHLSDAVISQN